MPFPACTIEEMFQRMTAPGQLLETTDAVVKGQPYKVYKTLPPSIGAMWYNTASTHFDKEYIIHNDTRLTYKYIHKQVELVGQKLVDCGVKKGDKVAIVSRNGPEYIIFYWAIHMIGGVSVLVNAWQTKTVILACLNLTNPKVVMVDDQRAAQALEGEDLSQYGIIDTVVAKPTRKYRSLKAWDEWVPKPGRFPALPSLDSLNIQPEDEATIYFTSGTTDLPKAVLSTQRQSLSNMLNTVWAFYRGYVRRGEEPPKPNPGDPQRVFLLTIPLFHVTGNCTYLHLYTFLGSKIVIMDKWNPKAAARLVEKEKVTNLGGVPSQPAELLQEKCDFSTIVGMGYGGAPPTTQLPREARKHFPKSAYITHAYGLTETNAIAFANSDEDYVNHPDSIGHPGPINQVKIINDKGEAVPRGTLGEICIRGPNVAECYYKNEAATKKAFDKDHWFMSGDLGYQDEEGFCYIKDRLKDVIIRGGENIAGGAVEAGLYSDERILNCCAVGIPERNLGEAVAAMVYLKEEYRGKTQPEDIIREAQKHLPKHEVPVFVHISDEPLPVNANGKLQKRDLKKVAERLYNQSTRTAAKL